MLLANLSNKKEKDNSKVQKANDQLKKGRSLSPTKLIEEVVTNPGKQDHKSPKKPLSKAPMRSVRSKALDQELLTAPKSKLLLNLKKTILASKKEDFDLGIEYQKIKSLFISFDSGKLTSTLINIDIEEMTYCLACVILKFIEYGENQGEIPFFQPEAKKPQKEHLELQLDWNEKAHKKFDDSRNFDLSDKISVTPALTKKSNNDLEQKIRRIDKIQQDEGPKEQDEENKIAGESNEEEEEEHFEEEEYKDYCEEYPNLAIHNPEDQDEIEFEQSKKEIESILKESLLVAKPDTNNIKPPFKNTATFQNLNPDPIREEGLNDNEEYEEGPSNQYYQSRMEENSKINVSMCSKITYFDENLGNNELSFSKDLETVFERAFNERSNERWITAVPSKDTISNFCKNIIITSKMEKEVTIISLIYIEKLIVRSGMHVTALNWRRIVFIALILASKVIISSFALLFLYYGAGAHIFSHEIILSFIKSACYMSFFPFLALTHISLGF